MIQAVFGLCKPKLFASSALISTLRISAFLCGSAVISPYSILTAEPQRNAEIRRVEIRAPLITQRTIKNRGFCL